MRYFVFTRRNVFIVSTHGVKKISKDLQTAQLRQPPDGLQLLVMHVVISIWT